MAGTDERRLSACAMCGLRFDPAEHTACASCPVRRGCALACCPACGYSFVDAAGSNVVRLGTRLSGRLRRGRGKPYDGTLAGLPPHGTARVACLDELPAETREQLQAYGLAPGREVEVLQARPVTVVRVDHVEIALESVLARRIRVDSGDD